MAQQLARLTDEQFEQYRRNGYLHLGTVADPEELAGLQQRIDDIMLGKAPLDYDRIFMQLDTDTGKYSDMKPGNRGHKGASLDYRKIQDLEFDPVHLAFMQKPVFRDICERVYGAGRNIDCFRAMFMNKPAHKGTELPWHQDRWTDLDRDPEITIWTAIDPATVQNGCVRVIPGSHHELYNPDHSSGFLTEDMARNAVAGAESIFIELQAGEAVLLHNWLLHNSDVNRSDIARRAFSVCYMDAATVSSRGSTFSHIFGEDSLTPNAVSEMHTPIS